VGFEVGATLVELNADHGDRVAKGQVIARLDAGGQAARVASAATGSRVAMEWADLAMMAIAALFLFAAHHFSVIALRLGYVIRREYALHCQARRSRGAHAEPDNGDQYAARLGR